MSDNHRSYGAYLLEPIGTRESGRGFEFVIDENQDFDDNLLAKLHS